MKKLIFAAIALIAVTATGFSQTKPAPKKNEAAKTQTVKKATPAKTPEKTVVAGKPMGHKKAKAHKKHNS